MVFQAPSMLMFKHLLSLYYFHAPFATKWTTASAAFFHHVLKVALGFGVYLKTGSSAEARCYTVAMWWEKISVTSFCLCGHVMKHLCAISMNRLASVHMIQIDSVITPPLNFLCHLKRLNPKIHVNLQVKH